ncbi:MAG TPA: hypothetical protein VKG62_03155, partial [Solirubrobacteraceae bacterium]|nr:hypothetical protein [Solirubrobacteraceae bacterium]
MSGSRPLATGLITILALAGCGGSGGSSSQGKSTPTATTTAARPTTGAGGGAGASGGTSTTTGAPSGQGEVLASTRGVTARMHATTHSPRVNAPWPVHFEVTGPASHPERASV